MFGMGITIKEVKTKTDLKKFIYLPSKIHKNHSNWVPPIYMDDWDYFNPNKNLSFAHCDNILLLAYENGQLAGRCLGLIHYEYNARHNEKNARFSYLETYDSKNVSLALIEFIAQWAKQKGMDKLIGPFTFSDKDPQGYLIEGFNQPVSLATYCNFPYLINLLEKYGFTKKVDLVVYKIDIPERLPEIYLKTMERFNRNNSNIRIMEFRSRAKVKPFIHPVLQLINKTFSNIYGFTPFTEKEMDAFANRYLYLINPNFIKVAINEHNEIIGTIIGMSDISKGIKKAGGHLLPFGFYHILSAGKKSNQLNLLLGAIEPRYQGRGLDVMMGIKMLESAKTAGKTVIDSHLELETNTKVRAEMERMGGVVYKKFRIFEKAI
jgi:GNAT superfamily N-acetyltransferase